MAGSDTVSRMESASYSISRIDGKINYIIIASFRFEETT